VAVVGRAADPQWKALVAAAHRIKTPWKLVLPLDEEKSMDRIHELAYPIPSAPTAYVCVGTECLPPILSPEGLIAVSPS
jgi:uncharacterized protein YyaL (SSP411 family)